MADNPWFKDWFNSPYYHLLYANRDDKEAAAFIDKLIEHLQPVPGATMLDVACGKGRHSIHLAEKGFDVTGIDLSEESIAEALTHQTDKLHFYIHDMRLPFWINYFDFAFNFFTSFGYFKTQRENDNAIRTIAQSINSKGRFVMDYLNTQCAEANTIRNMEKDIHGVHYAITKWVDAKHFYKKIIITHSALKEPLEYIERVEKFTLTDFTTMFEKQGLNIQEVYGDYDFAPYDVNTSQRLIMIASKKTTDR